MQGGLREVAFIFSLILAFSYILFAYRHKQMVFSMFLGAIFCVLFVVGAVCGEKTLFWMEVQPYFFITLALLPFMQFIISTYLYGFFQFFFWWFVVATLNLIWFVFIGIDSEILDFAPLIVGISGIPLMLFVMALYLALRNVRFPKVMKSIFGLGLLSFFVMIIEIFTGSSLIEQIGYIVLLCLAPFAFLSFILFYVGFLFVLFLSCLSD